MIDEILWLDSLEWNIFVSEKMENCVSPKGQRVPLGGLINIFLRIYEILRLYNLKWNIF